MRSVAVRSVRVRSVGEGFGVRVRARLCTRVSHLIGEHGQVGEHVMLDLVVEPAVQEVIGVRACFRVPGLGFGVWELGFTVSGFGLRVFRFQVQV